MNNLYTSRQAATYLVSLVLGDQDGSTGRSKHVSPPAGNKQRSNVSSWPSPHCLSCATSHIVRLMCDVLPDVTPLPSLHGPVSGKTTGQTRFSWPNFVGVKTVPVRRLFEEYIYPLAPLCSYRRTSTVNRLTPDVPLRRKTAGWEQG
jgi:hypothetical protein